MKFDPVAIEPIHWYRWVFGGGARGVQVLHMRECPLLTAALNNNMNLPIDWRDLLIVVFFAPADRGTSSGKSLRAGQ